MKEKPFPAQADPQSGIKKYSCPQCHKSFVLNKNRKMHSLIHTGEEPQKCKQCNFSCNKAGNLKRHIKKQTREKLHHCDQCEYKATDAVHEHRPLCEILFRMMTKTMLMISMTLMIMTMMVPRACHSVTVPQCHSVTGAGP